MPKRIVIDGQEILVPEGALTGTLLRKLANVPQDCILYRVSSEGHTVIHDHDPVEVREGEQIGVMTRVRAA